MSSPTAGIAAATESAVRPRPDPAPAPPAPPESPPTPPPDPRRPRPVSARIVAATAGRVLTQLRGDRRTVAMLLVVPSVLLVLVHEMFTSQRSFDRTGLSLLGIFPFTLMFLITSVAMLRERTSGTLERLLTTPMSTLDLLLGYGLAFTVAAAAQAGVTCTTAYLLLGLYTPGSPALVVGVALAGALLGMALGLLCSAFATSEFQAVQFMPAVVIPQILLGGLFVPREQMSNWLYVLSGALPMTYSIEALGEVGKTELITAKLVRDVGIVAGASLLALVLAASTLRRRTGPRPRAVRVAMAVAPAVVLAASVAVSAGFLWTEAHYVRTDNAQIDADEMPMNAPATGTLVDWRATQGTAVRRGEVVGRIEAADSFAPVRTAVRAPGDGTVVLNPVVDGAYVTAGTRLAVAYDLGSTYVTARVDETDLGSLRPGRPVEISVDAFPDTPLAGVIQDLRAGSAALFSTADPDNTTGIFRKVTQVIPVRITIMDRRGLTLLPGMNVTVSIPRD